MKALTVYAGWSSFLMASAMEVLVFALIDPQDLRYLGGDGLEVSRRMAYSMAFFFFWGMAFLAALLTVYLAQPRDPQAVDLLESHPR